MGLRRSAQWSDPHRRRTVRVEARLCADDPAAEQEARTALADYAGADGSRFAVVIRRPLRRALLLLPGTP
jgi:hypothetical protein